MAELLCTRLCHDLTGPIGAVSNGAEFLSEEGFNMQGQAMELIISSSFSAVTRLQFYRMAYGRVKEQGEANLGDKQKLAMDYFAGSKITLDWPDSHTDSAAISISQKMSRLICNMLIIASGTLIRGGNIAVRLSQDDATLGKKVEVLVGGQGLKWEKIVEQILAGDKDAIEMDTKNVQIFLSRAYADELGARFNCVLNGESLSLSVIQPPHEI
ncbi:MAG: histidine phosphotransferase family protein [Alphaproteobacteria bacterium]